MAQMRRSVAEILGVTSMASTSPAIVNPEPSAVTPDPSTPPAAAAAQETPKRQTRRWTNDECLAMLDSAAAHERVPGRTLPKGKAWDGRDLP